jgi:hypothetical protein
MTFFTREQYERLIHNGTLKDHDPQPVVKLHLEGTDCVWLLTELNPNDPMIAFGLCDLGLQSPELGYVDLSELASLKLPFNNTVQPDEDFIGLYPISVYAAAARECGAITEDQEILRQFLFPRKSPGLRPV